MAAERARSNLARYVSPNLVEELAGNDGGGPFDETRRQDIAVLFVNLVGFTQAAAELRPESAMALLREFHQRVADVVFAYGGTLDKYIGDRVMATFGTTLRGRRARTDLWAQQASRPESLLETARTTRIS